MIDIQDVQKVFGKKANRFVALQGVSFSVPSGSSLAIVGKSGSGKSTLMHVMSGLDPATSGQVIVDGQNLATMKQKAIDEFRSEKIGFIFQSFFVEANQTVLNNVSLPLEIVGMRPSRRRKLAQQALEQVELGDKAKVKAKNLSGGQKQRLAIARAIVNKPSLIFADEPTGNLDSVTGKTIIDLLFSFNKKLHATLVIVTHDQELANLCDIQLHMKDGRVDKILKKNKNTKVRP